MMKNPKILGPLILGFSLVLISSCGKDDPTPCQEATFYLDNDGDGEGDSTKPKMACEKPENHVTNANDPDDSNAKIFSSCTMVTYYLDNDEDTYGDPDEPLELCDGVAVPEKYVTDNTDCDDSNPNVNPGAEEIANDGIDNNCDGYVLFSKSAQDDWTDPQYQDVITEKVTFTRQDNDYLFNLTWWEENIGNAPTHMANSSDLGWEFWGTSITPFSNVTGHSPTGGTKGVRWALLDIDTPDSDGWNSFELYGNIGDNTHFYSWHNVIGMATYMDYGSTISFVNNDFSISYMVNDMSFPTDQVEFDALIGKTLGVWLVEEDIYLTLKIMEWTPASEGGIITYERSTPE